MKTYIVDEEKSKITWKGTDEKNSNRGELKFNSGKLFAELGEIVEGFVGIDLSSLKVAEDTQMDKENEEKLIEHLKSREFLNTDEFPTAKYKIVKVIEKDGDATIKGVLNLKEEAFGFNFPANVSISDQKFTAEGNFTLQSINPVLKDKITANYDGDPIETIELNFKLEADAEAL